ncbi:MAG: hypothetical protein Q7R45_07295 [Sulfuricaulis sp.]|nr:hypothetical protein [Sulfuricaulis sp.]
MSDLTVASPHETTSGPIVVKIPAAMMMLSTSRSRIYELLDAGEIEGMKDGETRKILVASIRDYVARQLQAAKAA